MKIKEKAGSPIKDTFIFLPKYKYLIKPSTMPVDEQNSLSPQIVPIQSTISREEALRELEMISENKLDTMQVDGKRSTYIKELVNKLHPFWWRNMLSDLNSDDKETRKAAMVEFNKLQCRVLPTEIGQSADSDAITLNITNFIKPSQIDE